MDSSQGRYIGVIQAWFIPDTVNLKMILNLQESEPNHDIPKDSHP